MRVTKWAGVAITASAAALLLAAPATAQDDTELPSSSGASEHLAVTVAVTGNCTATITYTNAVPAELAGSWAYWGDYRAGDEAGQPDSEFPDIPRDSDGQLVVEDYQDGHNHGVDPDTLITSGPLAGEAFGLQHNPVLIHQGDTRTVDVVVNAPTTLAAWIKRGPEQPWYVGEVAVEVPCEKADDGGDQGDDTPPAKDEDQDDEDQDDAAGGTGGGEGELPLTGSTTTLLGGGAVLLLGLGGGAYLVARRRRVSFSA